MYGHNDWVQAVVWSPHDGRLATASRDETARIWDAQRRRPPCRLLDTVIRRLIALDAPSSTSELCTKPGTALLSNSAHHAAPRGG
ncbi:MAG: hypothetical protein ACT4NP_08630 [Pseudonocardiales bacterium]